MAKHVYNNVNVRIEESRWSVKIIISTVDGNEEEVLIASADSFYTEGSSIFFDTESEYRKRQNW